MHVHRLFVASLFVTAKVRRQPEYSSIEECSNMKWLLYAMDYNLDVSDETLMKEEEQMGSGFQGILLIEKSNMQETSMLPSLWKKERGKEIKYICILLIFAKRNTGRRNQTKGIGYLVGGRSGKEQRNERGGGYLTGLL